MGYGQKEYKYVRTFCAHVRVRIDFYSISLDRHSHVSCENTVLDYQDDSIPFERKALCAFFGSAMWRNLLREFKGIKYKGDVNYGKDVSAYITINGRYAYYKCFRKGKLCDLLGNE